MNLKRPSELLFDRNLRYSTVNHKRRLNPFPHDSFSMAEGLQGYDSQSRYKMR